VREANGPRVKPEGSAAMGERQWPDEKEEA